MIKPTNYSICKISLEKKKNYYVPDGLTSHSLTGKLCSEIKIIITRLSNNNKFQQNKQRRVLVLPKK